MLLELRGNQNLWAHNAPLDTHFLPDRHKDPRRLADIPEPRPRLLGYNPLRDGQLPDPPDSENDTATQEPWVELSAR